MGRNSTLGDFAEGSSETPDPIEPVHRWTPEPVACPRCGEQIQGLWLEGGTTGRCTSCKEW